MQHALRLGNSIAQQYDVVFANAIAPRAGASEQQMRLHMLSFHAQLVFQVDNSHYDDRSQRAMRCHKPWLRKWLEKHINNNHHQSNILRNLLIRQSNLKLLTRNKNKLEPQTLLMNTFNFATN